MNKEINRKLIRINETLIFSKCYSSIRFSLILHWTSCVCPIKYKCSITVEQQFYNDTDGTILGQGKN